MATRRRPSRSPFAIWTTRATSSSARKPADDTDLRGGPFEGEATITLSHDVAGEIAQARVLGTAGAKPELTARHCMRLLERRKGWRDALDEADLGQLAAREQQRNELAQSREPDALLAVDLVPEQRRNGRHRRLTQHRDAQPACGRVEAIEERADVGDVVPDVRHK